MVDKSSLETNWKNKSVEYFAKIIEAKQRPHVVASHFYLWVVFEKMNTWLSHRPLEKEVKEILFSLAQGKAPGPDGFTALFFQKFWIELKLITWLVSKNFFKGNPYCKQQTTHGSLWDLRNQLPLSWLTLGSSFVWTLFISSSPKY